MPESFNSDPPDGYMVRHNRMTDTLHFGPFLTYAECLEFLRANRLVTANVVPLYKTVDWNRRG
jgi:hypothetical protein